MRKIAVPIVALLAVAGVIGFVATSGGGSGSGATPSAISISDKGERAAAVVPLPGELVTDQSAEGLAGGAETPLSDVGNIPAFGPDIVKTAMISIEVKKGSFQDAFNAASVVAGSYGGYVQDSSMAGTKSKSGSLTIRVPSARFDEAMSDLRELGTVQNQSISGQDVTSQYVDLQARLRTWRTQEAVLLRLMRRATSIEATLRVQTQLQDVQFRIEQIKGQLRVLENQTSLATIQVGIREVGAPVVKKSAVSSPSLGEAWDRALAGFLGVVFAVVVGLGYLVPALAIAAAAWFGYRRLRPRAATS
ncbi:MAG: DUF4349 domain-containing protein [Actinomycetota bacterium]